MIHTNGNKGTNGVTPIDLTFKKCLHSSLSPFGQIPTDPREGLTA